MIQFSAQFELSFVESYWLVKKDRNYIAILFPVSLDMKK